MSLQMLLSDAAPFRRDEGRGVARKTFAPRRTWPEAEAHPLPVEVGDGRQPAQDGRSCVPDWPGRRRGPSCVSSPRRPARPDGSRPINCATPTRSNSRARASRSTSSSSRSDTPTSAPPRHTSRASTRATSSTRSAFADHPPCRPPPDSRSGNNTRQRDQGAAPPTGQAGRALGLACARAAARLDGAVSSGLARTREVAAVTG